MDKGTDERLAIGECPQCGQSFFGLWVMEETRLELHCPSCARRNPGASGKLVKMRTVPIPSKKGGEW